MPHDETNCRSCGARIIFVRMVGSGALMPLNADPDPKGTVVLTEQGGAVLPKGLFAGDAPAERYTSHFVTCPDRAKFRRKN